MKIKSLMASPTLSWYLMWKVRTNTMTVAEWGVLDDLKHTYLYILWQAFYINNNVLSLDMGYIVPQMGGRYIYSLMLQSLRIPHI